MTKLSELLPGCHGRVHVSFDEGGLRCTWGDGGGYLPWGSLADVALEESAVLGRPVLALTAPDGDDVRLKLENPNPLEVHGVVLRQLADRKAGGPPRKGLPALTRAGAPLDEWLRRVVDLAVDGGGYRGAALDRGILGQLLSDEHADIEARAAAAHALLATGDDEEISLVTRAFVLHALPPLVLVAGRLAPGGAALMDDPTLLEIARLLPAADREAAERVRALGRVSEREALVADGLRRATDEARKVPEGPETVRWPRRNDRHRPLAGGGGGGDTRWVGRTWAI